MLSSFCQVKAAANRQFGISFDEMISPNLGDGQQRGKRLLDLQNKKVLVVGLAKTGLAVARFLKHRGATVTATDALSAGELGAYGDEAVNLGISLEAGGHDVKSFEGSDLIVVSPGVPERIPPLEAARRKGVPIIGEIELASRFIGEPIVAITGTNGKTTTTKLIGEMLRASGKKIFVGGNIGAPLIDYVDSRQEADVVVAEISSFQLDTTEQFRPHIATLLNITADHLDRYDGFNDYVRSKGRIFLNQHRTDIAVLNRLDPAVNTLESSIVGQRMYFNLDPAALETGEDSDHGVAVQDGELVCRLPEDGLIGFDLANLRLEGKHNVENVAAAVLTAVLAGGSRAGIQASIDSFEGLPHRLQHIGNVQDVAYYNDSKATNVDAVKRSLESFERPVILIMGGRDKGGSYSVLKELIRERVKSLVVFGEAREKILAALGDSTGSDKVQNLAEAVHMAYRKAVPGDVVLLSPGCSSFDMFSDYTERGEAFRIAVKTLAES